MWAFHGLRRKMMHDAMIARVLVVSGLLALVSQAALAQARWTNAAGDNDFANPSNWDTGVVPTRGTGQVRIVLDGSDRAIVDANDEIVTDRVMVGYPSGPARLDMTGGRLTSSQQRTMQVGHGATGTLNISGGEADTGKALIVGLNGGHGTVNITGGGLTLRRAENSKSLFVGHNGGTGTLNMSGGTLWTRRGVNLGGDNGGVGTFRVTGSAPSFMGIGNYGGGGGFWNQRALGTLEVGIDENGITPIFIDDYEESNNAGGDVTFANGAILKPFDAGVDDQDWHTVMSWEGALTDNGLTLDPAAAANHWEYRYQGRNLQVRQIPEPGALALVALGSPLLLRHRRCVR
jgi:hypothetical protein